MTKRLKRVPLQLFTAPRVEHVPEHIAQAIGGAVSRYAILEHIQVHILSSLLGTKRGHGRLVLRINRPDAWVQTIKNLVRNVGIDVKPKWSGLKTVLDAAHRARNDLAHSLFIRRKGLLVTAASWDFGNEYHPEHRALYPEPKKCTRKYLRKQRLAVELAVRRIHALETRINLALGALNEKRRTKPHLDRRLQKS